jgi:hypothetical protein
MDLVRLRPYEGLARSPRAKAAPAVDVSELAPIWRTSQKGLNKGPTLRFPSAEEALTREMQVFKKCKTLG